MSAIALGPQPVTESIENRLAACRIFSGLSTGTLKRLAKKVEIRSYAALEEAAVEGEVSTGLHVVISGRFVVLLPSHQLTRYGDNAMLSLECFVTGDSFGESALADDMLPDPASIVATEPSQVLVLSRKNFERIADSDAAAGFAVYRNLFQLQSRRIAALSTTAS